MRLRVFFIIAWTIVLFHVADGQTTAQPTEDPEELAKQAKRLAEFPQQTFVPTDGLRPAECDVRQLSDPEARIQCAITLYRKTADLWRLQGNRSRAAESLTDAARLQWKLGMNHDSLDTSSEAAELYDTPQTQRERADVLIQKAQDERMLSHLDDTFVDLLKARSISEGLIQPSTSQQEREQILRQRGKVANELGLTYFWKAEYQLAEAEYHNAMEIWRILGKPNRSEAFTHQLLGRLYSRLGRYVEAITELQQAYEFQKTLSHDHAPGRTLTDLAIVFLESGNYQQAADYFRKAEEMGRQLPDPEGLAETLSNEAVLHLRPGPLHDNELAFKEFHEALRIQRQASDAIGVVDTELRMARSLADQGQWGRVLENLTADGVLELAKNGLYRSGEAEAHYLLGVAYESVGQLENARAELQSAVQIQELQHEELHGGPLHVSFSSNSRRFFEAYVELLEKMAEVRGGDFSTRALEASEQSRARALLEHLNSLRVDWRKGAPAELLSEEHELREKLSEQYRTIASGRGAVRQARTEAPALETRLEIVEAAIRSQSPVRILSSTTFKLASFQGTLDGNTLILEYFLGQNRSYVWAVTRERLLAFPLPARSQIEQAASQYYLATSSVTSDPALVSRRAALLAKMILPPESELLATRKIVVVPDGMISRVPFAALPDIRRRPLIERHQIAVLPSLSILNALQQPDPLAPPPKTIAIFADPVFSGDDTRLPRQKNYSPPAASNSVAVATGDANLPRLSSSREEAAAIAAMVAPEARSQFLGFQATLESATSNVLAQFRILHFSTHAIFDSIKPERSRLIFSAFDTHGRRQPNRLLLNDIYGLQLRSDLVVLSSCDSGVGRQAEAEGPLSLSRGFLSAGSRRVLTTLWKVDDEATAAFMRLFYRGLLREHRPTAEALRRAQVGMTRHPTPRFRSPYYWAAFELQGDWR